MTMRALLTGANGFVGAALHARLLREGVAATGAVRAAAPPPACATAPDLGAAADWAPLLHDKDVVIHAAARVHMMSDTADDPLSAFRAVNVDGTLALARQAAAAGVRRFVFLSSIKVHGEASAPGRPFTADDPPAPIDPYAISKAEAEDGLRTLAAATGLELVIIRPPLVYGPGVKANFEHMMRWLARGVPLPFGALDANRRSLVAIDNLVDLIRTCIDHPAAANQAFLLSDGEDLSTTALLRRLAAAMGAPSRLLPVPAGALMAASRLLGRQDTMQRLCANLQVDMTQTRQRLGWRPPIDVDEGLRRAAAGFLA
jgi:nucleoside-diphosphate-sugar epimerase